MATTCLPWRAWPSLYFQQDEPQKTLQLVKRALQQSPDAEKPNLILARLLHRAGNLVEAEACYDRVLRTNPKNQTALLFKGNLTSLRGRLDEATSYYQRLLELSPDSPGSPLQPGTVTPPSRP